MNLNDLRTSTKEIRQWLANIRAEMNGFRTEMMQELKTFTDKDQEKTSIYAMIDLSEDAIEVIDRLYASVQTLSSTPPGAASAVIDFIHQLVMNQDSDSSHEKFKKKLDDINSSILNLRLRAIERSMGLQDNELESLSETISRELNLNKDTKSHVKALVDKLLSSEPISATEIEQEIAKISKQLEENDPNTANAKLSALVGSLKQKLATLSQDSSASQQHKDKIMQALSEIKIATYRYVALTKWSASEYSAFLDNISAWQMLLDKRISQSKQYLSKIETQVGNTNSKEAPLTSKYVQFFSSVLGEHNPNSVPRILKSLRDRIMAMKKALSSAIDNNGNDRESLSKNPDLLEKQENPTDQNKNENQ